MAVQSKKQPLLLLLLPLLLLLVVVQEAQGARMLPAAAAASAWRSPNSNSSSASDSSKCLASSVTVSQTNTGARAGYDPVFEVAVRNGCGRCAVRGVVLRSEGFASSVAVDPRLFRREGRDYLVGDGRRIEPGAEVRFRYAWDRAFRMATAAVQDDCS